MKALSLTQPMAWAIFNGKDIENRNWPAKFRGRIIIHASQGFNIEHYRWLVQHGIDVPAPGNFIHGYLIGEVDIVDCVTSSDSKWFFGKYGFVLANAKLYDKPIPYKGQLRLFNVEL
jgi:hypothetical protein